MDGSEKIVLHAPYRSGWFTVVLPTLEFLVLWLGTFFLVLVVADWTLPDWVGMLAFFLAIPFALAACVPSCRLLRALAERGRGVVMLSGSRIRWRQGWR